MPGRRKSPQRSPRRAQKQGAAYRRRRRRARALTGRLWTADGRRNREMGQGDADGPHQTRWRPTITAMTFHNARSANGGCRRQIEKSPLAPIEMSLSPVFESDGELAADDGDFDEPFGDRSDERFARSGRGADQGF